MSEYIITDFPKGEEHWLLTGVGPVSLYEQDFRVEIDFVAIDFALYLKNPGSLKSLLRLPNKKLHRTQVRVGIDFLAFAETGSVWHRQQLVSLPTQPNLDIARLDVRIQDAQKGQLVPLDELIEVPHKYHPFAVARDYHRSPALAVTADNFTVRDRPKLQTIIIPPSELIRFYFCGSGYFLRQLLAGGIAQDEVYIRSLTQYDPETKEAYVKLRKHLYDSDAPYAGRIALDRAAYKSAMDIGRSLQKTQANRQRPLLTATFPFTGSTTLSVAGKWVLLRENSDNWGFLVYSIIRCTARFPFDKLWVARDNDNQQTDNPLSQQWANTAWSRVPPTPIDGSRIGSTKTPDPQTSRVPVARLVADKFTHRPEVERVKKEQQQVQILGRRPTWLSQVEGYSTSDNPTEQGNTASGTLETQQETPAVDYTALESIVGQLHQTGVTCTYLHRSSNWSENTAVSDFAFPVYDPTNTSTGRWRLVPVTDNDSTGRKRVRRIAIVRMVRGGTGYYLVECEARPSERFSRVLLHQPGTLSMSPTLLDAILRLLAQNRGVWSHCNLTTLGLIKQPFYHLADDTPAAVAKRLLRYMSRPK